MKVLINSREEFEGFISNIVMNERHYVSRLFGGLEDVESYFGIRFCYTNGEFAAYEWEEFEEGVPESARKNYETLTWDEHEELEGLGYDISRFYFLKNHAPKSYPFLMVGTLISSFDRIGQFSVRYTDYVYLDDFTDSPTPEMIMDEEECASLTDLSPY